MVWVNPPATKSRRTISVLPDVNSTMVASAKLRPVPPSPTRSTPSSKSWIMSRPPVERIVEEGVGPGSSIQDVVPAAAHQDIGFGPARKHRGAAIVIEQICPAPADEFRGDGAASDKDIGMGAADDDLDAFQPVALAVAARSGAEEAHIHALRAGRVVGPVAPGAAAQQIGTAAPDQDIVAEMAVERVCRAIAGEPVAKGAAEQVLDAGEAVARRIAASRAVGRKIHGHRCGRVGVAHPVGAAPAIIAVGTAAAIHDIVPGAAEDQGISGEVVERVITAGAIDGGAGSARNHEIGKARSDGVLDPGQRIALGEPARDGAVAKEHRDRGIAGGIVHGVRAGSAIERIRALIAEQDIIAAIGLDRVIPSAAREPSPPRPRA